MNVAMSVGLVLAAILGACLLVLWYGSATVIDKHEDRITGLENRWAETFGGPDAAAEGERFDLDEVAREFGVDLDDTDEFPVAPPNTEPMALVADPTPAVQARRDAAWDEQRPSPVPRDLSDEFPHPVDSDERKAKRAADVEERLKRFDFSGRNR